MDRIQARALLGLRAGYTAAELDAAFRRRAMVAHPDRGGDPEEFKALVRSREILLSAPPGAGAVVVVDDSHRFRRLLRWIRRYRPATARRVS